MLPLYPRDHAFYLHLLMRSSQEPRWAGKHCCPHFTGEQRFQMRTAVGGRRPLMSLLVYGGQPPTEASLDRSNLPRLKLRFDVCTPVLCCKKGVILFAPTSNAYDVNKVI